MKINPISNPNILTSYMATKAPPAKQKTGGAHDEVTFSSEVLNFSKAMEEARDVIEFRTQEERDHIAKLTESVRQGTYKVESDKIADKILESVFRR